MPSVSGCNRLHSALCKPQLTDERTETEPNDNDNDVGSVASTSAIASQNKNAKKLKVVSDLSPEEEQSMVEWSEAHPIMYNKKLTSYKETTKKERMWMEKAVVVV